MLFEIGLAAAAELWMAMDGHHNGSSLPGWTFPLTNLMMDFIFNVPEVDDFPQSVGLIERDFQAPGHVAEVTPLHWAVRAMQVFVCTLSQARV